MHGHIVMRRGAFYKVFRLGFYIFLQSSKVNLSKNTACRSFIDMTQLERNTITGKRESVYTI